MYYVNHLLNTEPVKCDRPKSVGDIMEEVEGSPGRPVLVSGYNVKGRSINITKSGTEKHPIELHFEDCDFKEVDLNLRGNFIRVVGLNAHDSQIAIYGDRCRVTQCVLEDGDRGGSKDRLSCALAFFGRNKKDKKFKGKGPRGSRIDHNHVTGYNRRALRAYFFTERMGYNLIDQNLIDGYRRLRDGERPGNGVEPFQDGNGLDDSLFNPHTLFAYNQIGDEANPFELEAEGASLKASGGQIVRNTVYGKTNFVFRTGSHAAMMGNKLYDRAGIQVYGDHNVVYGNLIDDDGKLRVRAGDAIREHLMKRQRHGCHPTARFGMVAKNTLIGGMLEIGRAGTGKREYYKLNAKRRRIVEHKIEGMYIHDNLLEDGASVERVKSGIKDLSGKPIDGYFFMYLDNLPDVDDLLLHPDADINLSARYEFGDMTSAPVPVPTTTPQDGAQLDNVQKALQDMQVAVSSQQTALESLIGIVGDMR